MPSVSRQVLFSIAFILYLSSFSYGQNTHETRPANELNNPLPEHFNADSLLTRASVLLESDVEEADALAELLIANEHIKKDPLKAGQAYYIKAEGYYKRGEFANAKPYYAQANKLYLAGKDTVKSANIRNCLGLVNYYTGDFKEALSHFIAAYQIYTNNKLGSDAADILTNMAMIHKETGNYNEAHKKYREALQINEQINDSTSMAIITNGLGLLELKMGDPEHAQIHLIHSLNLFRQLGDKEKVASALNNLAIIFEHNKEYTTALHYYKDALRIFEETNNSMGIAYVHQGLGACYNHLGYFGNAIESYNKAIMLSRKNKYPILEKDTSLNLYELYKKANRHDKALQYYERYTTLKDSLFNEEKSRHITQLEAQYEADKKNREIVELRLKNELNETKIHSHQLESKIAYGIAGCFLIILIILFNRFLENQKSSKRLEVRNKKIKHQNALVKEMNEEYKEVNEQLRKLNHQKDKFFSIIAHDLKNPFHALLGLSFIMKEDYLELSDAERISFSEEINSTSIKIFQLLDNLLAWSKAQTGQITYTPEEIHLSSFITEVYENMVTNAESKEISITTPSENNYRVMADPLMLETILKNLVSNAIKFTDKGGNVVIAIRETPKAEMIEVSITDNGIGISPAVLDKLFKIDSKIKRQGTMDEEGSGLGLMICKEFIEQNGGEIGAESTLNQGSRFWITLPKALIES